MPNSTQQSVSTPPNRRPPLAELVALTAMLMALNPLAIGIKLSALPQMGADFAVVQENDRKLIIVSCMLGPPDLCRRRWAAWLASAAGMGHVLL